MSITTTIRSEKQKSKQTNLCECVVRTRIPFNYRSGVEPESFISYQVSDVNADSLKTTPRFSKDHPVLGGR